MNVHFVDINERAISLTKMNLKHHRLEGKAYQSDRFSNVKETFHTILLNPPQTAGKEICFKLIEESKHYLKEKGYLQIVARHNKGGKVLSGKMKEVFGNMKEGAKKAGFRIYTSQKQ